MITLILLFTVHYLGDFTPIVRPYMLKAKEIGSPTGPIVDHALIHAILVFLVLWLYGCNFCTSVLCLSIEAISHFGIDYLKGKVNYWSPSVRNTDNPWHWMIFGLDQLLHAIILIFIAKICNII